MGLDLIQNGEITLNHQGDNYLLIFLNFNFILLSNSKKVLFHYFQNKRAKYFFLIIGFLELLLRLSRAAKSVVDGPLSVSTLYRIKSFKVFIYSI